MAIAEKLLQFEHRDLHWGNVLIQPCTDKVVAYSHGSEKFQVDTHGIRATIIDFSLSRISLPNEEEGVIYNNLTEDPDLFTSEGDYQFDVYRYVHIFWYNIFYFKLPWAGIALGLDGSTSK